MLGKETKDKINNARDILVGQLPLPSDQIELITIALIYKFMDDIDEESRKLGGEVSFFRNGLGDYSWQKLLSNQLSGEERVQKFIHAIEAITKAPHIPELFKSIFRNTFLKFRDSRTLKLFLDEINKFKYEHSEELGNAFEYLLDSMGSQGENGQFRTPRNIIDFIVEVVDPDKDDKILDPACGTAGFLISAYKHILRKYTNGYEDYRISLNNYEIEGISIHWGDKLKVTEKDKLTKRIEGYDITPLMVRLSQVNMYLHHFPNPLIHDYDSLSNKSRWDDKYDCIFANPPFMTPKGGVEPHEQFRIRASKAEILFSDYIIEHLNPNGKAGWIVPEGIIFQGSGDYVTLRKWLTENMGLWAVVSLPANIFQPYSGVKTSILFVDRTLARLTNQIILVKVENDGFSLNTNRNPIKKNDLPSALNLLIDYKKVLPAVSSKSKESEQKVPEFSEKYNIKFKLLTRKEIAALDSYKAVSSTIDFCKREYKRLLNAKEKYEESYQKAKDEKQKQKTLDIFHKNQKHFIDITGFETIPFDEGMIKQWVNEKLKDEAVKYGKDRSNVVRLSQELREYLDNEREFNLSIDKYVNGNIDKLHSSWDYVSLGDESYFKVYSGGTPDTTNPDFWGKEIAWVTLVDLPADNRITHIDSTERSITKIGLDNSSAKLFPENSVLVSSRATIGRIAINKIPLATNQGFRNVIPDQTKVIPRYLAECLLCLVDKMIELGTGATYKEISISNFKSLHIPLPPIDIQQKIVDEIEGYQKVIDGCNLVIENYKPSFKIDEAWEDVKLVEVCIKITDGSHYSPPTDSEGFAYVTVKDLDDDIIDFENCDKIEESEYLKLVKADCKPLKNDILFSKDGTVGKVSFVDYEKEFVVLSSLAIIRPDPEMIIPRYLFYVLKSASFLEQALNFKKGVAIRRIILKDIKDIVIPLPAHSDQQEIVDRLDKEYKFMKHCKKLKTQMEQKIKEVIDGVWGKSTN